MNEEDARVTTTMKEPLGVVCGGGEEGRKRPAVMVRGRRKRDGGRSNELKTTMVMGL